MQRSLALVVMGPQLRGTKKDVEIVLERRRPVHFDAQRLGNRAVSATASHEVIGRNPLALVSHEITHHGDHAAIVLLERLEPAAQPQRDAGKAPGSIAQDRIEPKLVAALRPFRTDGARRTPAVVGALEACNLETRERREIENGVGKVPRRAGLTHPVSDPPSPEELHGAGVLGVGARMRNGAVALLHQDTLDAAPAKIDRKAEPDRTASHDQDRSITRHRLCSGAMMNSTGRMLS